MSRRFRPSVEGIANAEWRGIEVVRKLNRPGSLLTIRVADWSRTSFNGNPGPQNLELTQSLCRHDLDHRLLTMTKLEGV
jgi:hypothetical protein